MEIGPPPERRFGFITARVSVPKTLTSMAIFYILKADARVFRDSRLTSQWRNVTTCGLYQL